MTKRRIIRSHPTTANVTRWAARKAARMPKIERVRSVSAEMWLCSDYSGDWLLTSMYPIKTHPTRHLYRHDIRDYAVRWLCSSAAEKLFRAKLDPDAPPRRVRVTIELIDE